jgi:NAD(P)H-hydrate epimerase
MMATTNMKGPSVKPNDTHVRVACNALPAAKFRRMMPKLGAKPRRKAKTMAIPYQPGEPLTCRQIRALDALAIEQLGIPGIVLMENAARGAAEFIYGTLADPTVTLAAILCGPGNNGGDGFVIARHLRNAGVRTTVLLVAPESRYQSDAAVNLAIYRRMADPLELIDATTSDGMRDSLTAIARAHVVVDALLGTGSTGAPRGAAAELIRAANDSPHVSRIAIDIPSGLDGDSGTAFDPCFRADATVTFVAAKMGFSNPGASEYTGRVVVADIGIPRELTPGREKSTTSG